MDLFSQNLDTSKPIVLHIRGMGVVPSFKNCKLIRAWIDRATRVMEFITGHWWIRKDSIKIRSMLFLDPKHQEWMEKAKQSFELQLRSAFQTAGVEIRTDALAHSKIASLVPLDDCWTQCPEIIVRSELCAPGEEGATITIERL